MHTNQLHIYQYAPEELTDKILERIDRKFEELFERLNPSESDTEELLTIKETSKILKCSIQTLYNWREQGIIPSHRLGNRVYIYRRDIDAYLIKQ